MRREERTLNKLMMLHHPLFWEKMSSPLEAVVTTASHCGWRNVIGLQRTMQSRISHSEKRRDIAPYPNRVISGQFTCRAGLEHALIKPFVPTKHRY